MRWFLNVNQATVYVFFRRGQYDFVLQSTVCQRRFGPFYIVSYHMKWAKSLGHIVCQGSRDPFYIVTNFIKWVTSSWTYSTVV